MAVDRERTSSYLDLLPEVFSEDPFLGRYLLAFEHVLTGLPPEVTRDPPQGLEMTIASIASFFDPRLAPAEFIPWLAGWVALGLRADWTLEQQREFLARVVSLYRRRGTRENLAQLLSIYTGLAPVIAVDDRPEFQIGKQSTIGKNTVLGGGEKPHAFRVTLTLADPGHEEIERIKAIARAIIELEKPAHTTYVLAVESNTTIQIGKRSTIGVSTLLGRVPPNP